MSQQQPNVTSEVLDTTAAPAVQVVALFHEEVREVAELRMPKRGQRAEFVIGEAPSAQFHVAGLGALPLVRATEVGFSLTFLPSWRGEVTLSGSSASLQSVAQGRAMPSAAAPGALELVVPPSARISIDIGDVTFIVTSGAPARRYPAPLVVDRNFLGYLAGAAAFAAITLGFMNAVPPDNSQVSMDKLSRPTVVAELTLKAKDQVEQPDVAAAQGPTGADGSKGGAAVGPGGKMGDSTSTAQRQKFAIPDRGIAPTFADRVNKAYVRGQKTGIVGAMLRLPDGDRWALITGKGPIASDRGDVEADGGFDGPVGDQQGTDWGGNPDGDWWGGKGQKPNTVGNGNYDTIKKGNNDSPWESPNVKPGDPTRKPKGPKAPKGDLTLTEVQGVSEADREMIRREIRKHRGAFEACYERELLVDETLSGTVDTNFAIMANGEVRAVRAEGVSKRVSSCVAGVLGNIGFPANSTGSILKVTYPFSFRKAGE